MYVNGKYYRHVQESDYTTMQLLCNNEIHHIRDKCMPIGDFVAIGALFLIIYGYYSRPRNIVLPFERREPRLHNTSRLWAKVRERHEHQQNDISQKRA